MMTFALLLRTHLPDEPASFCLDSAFRRNDGTAPSTFETIFIRQIFYKTILDAFVKSPKSPFFVIPAKAGIQCFHRVTKSWTPFFNGVTTFYEFIILFVQKKIRYQACLITDLVSLFRVSVSLSGPVAWSCAPEGDATRTKVSLLR
jgi:hypothetical protein